MDTDQRRAIGSITQMIEKISQSLVILFIIIVLLFANRITVCTFYELPVVYNSLDPLRLLPLVIIFMFFLVILLLCSDRFRSSFDYVDYNNKENNNPNSESNDRITQPRDNTIFESIAKVLVGDSSSRNAVQKFIFSFWSKVHRMVCTPENDTIKESVIMKYIYMLAFCLVVQFSCFTRWVTGSIIIVEDMATPSALDLLNYVTFVLIVVSQAMIGYKFMKQWNKKVANLSLSNDEGRRKNVEKEMRKTKIQLIVFFILLFSTLSLWVASTESLFLRGKNSYDLLYIEEKNNVNSYAVILELDEFYVVEPVEENEDDLMINTGHYMYKEKDNVLVSRKRYKKVVINRNIHAKEVSEP